MDLTLLRAFATVAREGNLTRRRAAAPDAAGGQPADQASAGNARRHVVYAHIARPRAHARRPDAAAACGTCARRGRRRARRRCAAARGARPAADRHDPRPGLPAARRLPARARRNASADRDGAAARDVGLGDRTGAHAGARRRLLHRPAGRGRSARRRTVPHRHAHAFPVPRTRAGRLEERVQRAHDWRALATLPWIWTPPASAHHRLLSRRFAEAGAQPLKAAEVDQEQSMLDLVKSGIGLTPRATRPRWPKRTRMR